MVIYIGADHKGFDLKEIIKKDLTNAGYMVNDVGNFKKDELDDYVDFASAVALKVSLEFETSKGILFCGSGVGVSVVANKFRNVRCGLIFDSNQAFDAKNDDDINILAIPADYVDENTAKKIVVTWLQTPFSKEERHQRRLDKISFLELKMISSANVLEENKDNYL
jgi:ribose 5-phosphate isomerase B